jgi:hypothetical protein
MSLGIRELYPYAMAEGEGVGTAYEYFAKRRVAAGAFARLPERARVLVAGLPEKYGCSLDLLLASSERGAHVVVLDERPEAIAKLETTLVAARSQGLLADLRVEARRVEALAGELPPADLVACSEVLQRMPAGMRRSFCAALVESATAGLVFVPNSINGSHLEISGLAGMTPEELRELLPVAREVGLVDMPPFPPGITRSAEQRERATSGRAEAIAMMGLELYARAERFAPRILAERVAHIAYAAWG